MSSSSSPWKSTVGAAAAALVAGLIWIGCSQDGRDPTAPEDQLAALRQRLGPVINIQERHTERLLAIEGVVGTAVGLDRDGLATIKLFTAYTGIEGLPDDLEGVPVAIEVTGLIMALSDPTSRFARPVPTGVSTGHPAITAGTIGARVRDALGNVYALSNNHVYANQNDADLDDPILQPGAFDGGNDPTDRIGTLDSYEPILFATQQSTPLNVIDAAIAISSPDLLDNSTPADDGYGIPSSITATAYIGQPVQKYGRTTGLTHGEVSEINVTVDVCYLAYWFWCLKLARYAGQIGITPGGFSGGGDSGSLIVTDDEFRNPLGLLFAGGSDRTFANPIDAVLSAFGVTIDDTPPTPTTPLTDIALVGIDAPASDEQGNTLDIGVIVRNTGNQNVDSDFDVTLTDQSAGELIGTQTIVGGLAPGASATLTYNWFAATTGVHTLVAEHYFSDEDASNNAASTSITIEPPTVKMHVGDLDGWGSYVDKRWSAFVTVRVHDSGHALVGGATVTGVWSNGASGTVTCTTITTGSTTGQCTVYKANIRKRRQSVTFTVTSVTHPTFEYVAAANHDADGDSDGTRIVVRRP